MVTEIEKQIVECEGKLGGFRQTHSEVTQRLSALESERQSYVMAARLDKDENAQQKLRSIDAEIEKLRRDDRDDQQVISQLTAQLTGLRSDLVKAKREAQFKRIRNLIQKRLSTGNGMQLVADLVEQINTALQRMKDDDRALAAELHRYDPSLQNASLSLASLAERRGSGISWTLRKVVPTPLLGPGAFAEGELESIEISTLESVLTAFEGLNPAL